MGDRVSDKKLSDLILPEAPRGDPRGEMRSYDPTARERMAEAIQAGIEALGVRREIARRGAQTIMGGPSSGLPLGMGVADAVPFLGTAMGLEEGGRNLGDASDAIKRGDYIDAAANAAGAALGIIPGIGPTIKGAKAAGRGAMAAGKAGERYAQKVVPQIMERGGMGADILKVMSKGTAGIPGVRYLDGGSRSAGAGTSNYVVFPGEEKNLSILERNGQPMIDSSAPDGMANGGAAVGTQKTGKNMPKQINTDSVSGKKQSLKEWAMAGGSVPLQYKGREHVWHRKVKQFSAGGGVYNTVPDVKDSEDIISGPAYGGGGAVKTAVKSAIEGVVDGIRKILPTAERDVNLQKLLEGSKTPMVLYHGTTATEGGKGAEAIRRIKPSKEGALGSGTYLTPQPDRANLYTRSNEGGGNVLPVYAQIKNPLIIEGTHGDPMVEALTKLGMAEDKASRMVERAYENKGYIGKEVESRARAAGYDGLMQYRDGDLSEVVSYNPNAVKSSIGNRGTYDTNIADLNESHGGEVHMGGGGATGKKAVKEVIEGGVQAVKKLLNIADEVPKGVEPIVVRTPEQRAATLQGALKPKTAPVRGETGKELRKAQQKALTDEEKETFELIKQKHPNIAGVANFMTPQEVSKIISNPAAVTQMDRLLNVLPSAKELSSVAKAGSPKQGWYRASTQAIIDVFGVDDAPRFASLLAALSPQTSVEMNLLNTVNTWKNWTAAGRPTDPGAIKAIMGQSVSGLKGEDSILNAWVNNATRSLSAADPLKVTLSGPKVDSFYRNLADDVYKVTNDAWMANGLGVDQALFGGSPTSLQLGRGDPGLSSGYIGTNAQLRKAGQQANMFPSEAQETAWSWFMPLYEMQRTTGLPARELLQRGMITPDVIRGTPDFSTLLNQGKYGDVLKGAGYEEQLAALKPSEWTNPRLDLSLSEQRDLNNAARRIEALRTSRGSESRSRSVSYPNEGESAQTAFAYATPEYIPGRKTGHLEELIDAPESMRQHFSSRVSNVFRNPAGGDVLQSSLDLNPLKTRVGTVAFRPEGEIPFAGGRLGGESTSGRYPMEIQPMFPSGAEVPLTSRGDIPQAIKNKLTAAEAVRGYFTAQRGSPWNAQIPHEGGPNIHVPLEKKADPENMGYASALANGRVDLADTGSGVSVLNWDNNLTAQEKQQLTKTLGGTNFHNTKHVGDYVDYGPSFESGEGSGEATRKMLGHVQRLPANQQGALSQAMQDPAGDLVEIYRKAKGVKREDLMRALTIARDRGLPGLAAALAAGEALPAEPTGGLPPSR